MLEYDAQFEMILFNLSKQNTELIDDVYLRGILYPASSIQYPASLSHQTLQNV
jgi:hypothetical protein